VPPDHRVRSCRLAIAPFVVVCRQFGIVNCMIPKTNKQTPWLLVRKRTIPTDRPPLFGEI
jgi:hypothetical protein